MEALGMAPFHSNVHSHTATLAQRQRRHTNSPNMHVFRVWVQTTVPTEKPWPHGKNMQIALSGPGWESMFFLTNFIMKQH